MNPISIFYIILAISAGSYSVIAAVAHLVHFTRKEINELPPDQRPKSVLALYRMVTSRFSELSKRSVLLTFICSLGCAITMTDGWLLISSQLQDSWSYPCNIPAVVRQFSWFWAIYAFIFKVIRLWMQVKLNQFKKTGVFAKSSMKAQSLDSSSALGLVSLDKEERLLSAQKKAEEETTEDLPGVETWMKYKHAFETYAAEETSFAAMVLFGGIAIVGINSLIGYFVGWFDGAVGCVVGPAYLILYFYLGVWILFVTPLKVYLLRGIKDAFYLAESSRVLVALSVPLFFIFFAVSFFVPQSELKNIFDGLNFCYIMMFTMVNVMNVVPIYRERVLVDKISNSYQGFVECLSDEGAYDSLKQCASEEFSDENPLFWESYYMLVKRTLNTLERFVEKDKITRETFMVRGLPPFLSSNGKIDHSILRSELLKPFSRPLVQHYAQKSKMQVDQSKSQVAQAHTVHHEELRIPMTLSMAKSIIKMYFSFVEEGSALELNLHSSFRNNLGPLIDRLAVFVDNFKETQETDTASNRKSMGSGLEQLMLRRNISIRSTTSTSVLPGTPQNQRKTTGQEIPDVYLVFHDINHQIQSSSPTEPDKLFISIHIFDEIKDKVLEMLYENTFPRFLKKQAAGGIKITASTA